MLVTVGITTNRRGRKTHRHVNGWAACGAGRIIAAPRPIADGDRLCRRCAKHLHTLLTWEIDDMRRKGLSTRAAMLEGYVDSGRSPAELAERCEFVTQLRNRLLASWARQEAPRPLRVAGRREDAPALF